MQCDGASIWEAEPEASEQDTPVETEALPEEDATDIVIEVKVSGTLPTNPQIPSIFSKTFTVPNPLAHKVYHLGDAEGLQGNGKLAKGIMGRIETFIVEALLSGDIGIEIGECLRKHWEKYRFEDLDDENPN